MQIVAALFTDGIELRQAPGPSTRIDLTGIQFSAAAPAPFPVTVEPHLVVIVRCGADEPGTGALEVRFTRAGGPQADGPEEVARNVQPLQVEPGRFAYRLVRAELEFAEPGTVEAHCRIDLGEVTVVPYTLLPPAD